jgi:hypothetical protein
MESNSKVQIIVVGKSLKIRVELFGIRYEQFISILLLWHYSHYKYESQISPSLPLPQYIIRPFESTFNSFNHNKWWWANPYMNIWGVMYIKIAKNLAFSLRPSHPLALTHPIQLNHILCGRNMSIAKIWLNNNFPNTQLTKMY